ncbi:MAG: DNA-binding response OmpR family regulator [Limisphaerales bacterium]|jgi:DNA-binding response OmpR family regulator
MDDKSKPIGPERREEIRLLLVDDSPDFVVAASDYLKDNGRFETVGVAFNAHDAIDLARRLEPDLVVMDYVLPELNGADATRQLKKLENPPRVFILSMHDAPEYQESALAAGADGFLIKTDLVTKFESLVDCVFNEPDDEGRSKRSLQFRQRARKLAKGARIVVVDDDKVTQTMVSHILGGAGYKVFQAGTGNAGYDLVKEVDPHLVLLDIGLPDISGLDVCRKIKSDPERARTLVMHLSATHRSDHDFQVGLDGGADAYYTFPIRHDKFLEQVDSLIRVALLEAALERLG